MKTPAIGLTICLLLLSATAHSQPWLEVGTVLDVVENSAAEGNQGPVLAASNEGGALVVYLDGRDQRVHALRLGETVEGASRSSIVLSSELSLDDAELVAGPTEFLLVSTAEERVLATRIRFDEEAVSADNPIPITLESGFSHPRATWGPNKWLIAYRAGTEATGEIQRSLLGLSGAPAVMAGVLSESAGDFALVGTASEYGIVFEEEGELILARLSFMSVEAGRVTVSSIFSGSNLRITLGSEGGYVAWFADGGQAAGATVSGDLLTVGAALPVTEIGVSVKQALLVSTSESIALVWSAADGLHQRAVGDVLGDPTEISEGDVRSFAVAIHEGDPSVISSEDKLGGLDLFLRPLEGGDGPMVTMGTALRPAAAISTVGTDYLVSWEELGQISEHHIFSRFVDEYGAPLGDVLEVDDSTSDQRSVSVAGASDRALITWIADGAVLKGRLLDGTTRAALGDPFTICSRTSGVDTAVSDGVDSEFIVAWVDRGETGVDSPSARVVQVPTDGLLSEDCGTSLGAASDSSTHMAVGSSGSDALVVWVDSTEQLVGSVVDGSDITPLEFEIASADQTAKQPTVAWHSPVWAVGSSQNDVPNGGTDIVVTFLDQSGIEGQVVFENGEQTDSDPVLSTSENTLGVFWFNAESGAIAYNTVVDSAAVLDSPALILGDGLAFGPLLAAHSGRNQDAAVVSNSPHPGGDSEDPRVVFRHLADTRGVLADAGGPYLASEGDELTLDGSNSAPTDIIDDFEWLLDSASLGTGQELAHLFLTPGDFILTLVVLDQDTGLRDQAEVPVVIQNVLPTIELAISPDSPEEGGEVEMTATAVDPGGLANLAITWDFGSGVEVEGTADTHAVVTRVFEEGDYEVCVRVEDVVGASADDCQTVTVANSAPVVEFDQAEYRINEGTEIDLEYTVTDGGQDPLSFTFTFDNGDSRDSNEVFPYPSTETYTFSDDDAGDTSVSPFKVCLRAVDDADAEGVGCTNVIVDNVRPVLSGTPPTVALEGVDVHGDPLIYETHVAITDAGDDDLITELDTDGLAGVDVTPDEDGFGVTISFTPTIALWVSDPDHTWHFVLSADDEDSESVPTLEWDVVIQLQDVDTDDLPDTCERTFGLTDETDTGAADFDGDGLSNREECLGETSPVEDDRPPAAPTVNAPADESEVATLSVTLSLTNLEAPEGVTYRYEFELYSLPSLVAESLIASAGVVSSTARVTNWRTEDLVDQTTYWWRARATNGPFMGPYSDVHSFTVALPNQIPGTPVAFSPEGPIESVVPEFTWSGVTDPDGDEVTYKFQIFRDELLTDPERLVAEIASTGEDVFWTPPEDAPLSDNTDYWWRVRAVDERGAESEWSNVLSIEVNAFNDLPFTPTIVSPEPGAAVATALPELVVTAVEDLDGDEITYLFVVATDEAFENIVDRAADVLPSLADGLVHHRVNRELEENGLHYWRAAARDRLRLGGFVQGTFTVNQSNDPPQAPVFQSPSQDESFVEVNPTLTVRNSTDPDGDSVEYDFRVGADADFDEVVFEILAVTEGEDGETSVVVETELTPGEHYFARARAVDSFGAEGPWSGAVPFRIHSDERLLEAPEPTIPGFGETLQSGTVELGVTNVDVSDDEVPVYDFALYSDQQLEDRLYLAEDVPESDRDVTVHRVDLRLESGEYFWHARVRIGEEVSPWSDTSIFQIALGSGADAGSGGDAGTGDAGGDFVEVDTAETNPTETGCCTVMGSNRGPSAEWFLFLACVVLFRRSTRRQ